MKGRKRREKIEKKVHRSEKRDEPDWELLELQGLFNYFDLDRSDTLDVFEIKDLFSEIGEQKDVNEIKTLIKFYQDKATGDKKGGEESSNKKEGKEEYVTRDLFFEMMKDLKKRKEKSSDEKRDETIQRAFIFFDKSKDGMVSVTEIKKILLNIKEKKAESLSDKQITKLIRVLDEDGDNNITFEEFKKGCMKILTEG